MKGFIRLMILGALITSLLSCASQPSEEDDSLTTQAYSGSDNKGAENASGDEFSDFDKGSGAAASGDASQAPAGDAATAPPAAGKDSDLALEDELNKANGGDHARQFEDADVDKQTQKDMQPQAAPEQQAAAEPPPAAAAEPPPPVVADAPTPPPEPAVVQQEPPPPAVEAPPAPEAAAPVQEVTEPAKAKPVEITDLKYKANDAGGTVVIEANGPLAYTTRTNQDLKQYVIEIPNSNLPKRLKRTLNTKDIKGAVGAVDAYQSPGSTVSRIVVQMRDGFAEPVVQQEGNSLLVVTSGGEAGGGKTASAAKGSGEATGTSGGNEEESVAAGGGESAVAQDAEGNVELGNNKILTSQSLEQYLSGNTKFYGRRISIETSNIDVRDALKFITEESGVNMVIAEEVKGNISLKLRQVPWDQALVLIMKARRLGYSRQGSVLRIEPIDILKKEEEDATKLAIARRNTEPLKVKMYSVSYAKVDELEKKVKDFLTERGKVVSDLRTNALVVTDIEESLNRVTKLVGSLDVAPPQVLIEGKIVEATDTFARDVGIQWGFSGSAKTLSTGPQGPIALTPSASIGNSTNLQDGGGTMGLSIATLDLLGNLSASLTLYEREDKVKVLSSPRIVTLTNEKADISQTNELPIKTIVPQTNGVPLISYQFKPLTLKLEVTPQITTEGTIIMKVSVSRQIQGPPVSTTDDTFSVNSREANTRVIVKNGQTAVIGGIYRTDLTDTTIGVPWLKDVPILGAFFRSTANKKEHSELLIFLTPRVLAQLDSGGTKPISEDQ